MFGLITNNSWFTITAIVVIVVVVDTGLVIVFVCFKVAQRQ